MSTSHVHPQSAFSLVLRAADETLDAFSTRVQIGMLAQVIFFCERGTTRRTFVTSAALMYPGHVIGQMTLAAKSFQANGALKILPLFVNGADMEP